VTVDEAPVAPPAARGRLPWRWIVPVAAVLAALVVAAVVAIPLGGWDTVRLRSAIVPEYETGEAFAGNRFAISPVSAELADEHPDEYTEAEPGERWLLLRLDAENLRDEPELPGRLADAAAGRPGPLPHRRPRRRGRDRGRGRGRRRRRRRHAGARDPHRRHDLAERARRRGLDAHRPGGAMRRATRVLAGIGLGLLAFGVAYAAPDEDQQEAPFVTRAAPGERAEAGNLAARLFGVRAAELVESEDWVGETRGVWLLADLQIAARQEYLVPQFMLELDGRLYWASTRSDATLDDIGVDADLPRRGTVLFEVPRDALDRADEARILFSDSGIDPRLGTRLRFDVDLADIEVEDRISFDDAERVPW